MHIVPGLKQRTQLSGAERRGSLPQSLCVKGCGCTPLTLSPTLHTRFVISMIFFLGYITLAVKLDDRFVQNFVGRKEAT